MNNSHSHIILFDGVCNLCNSIVQFVIKHDHKAVFKFASLQSETGQALLQAHGLSTNDFDTIVLVVDSSYYIKSKAVLLILKELRGMWRLMYVFIILPRPLRDFIYNRIAKSRYKLFGKRESCMIPTPELKERFL